MAKIKKIIFLFIILLVGCGDIKTYHESEFLDQNESNIKVLNNGKVIYMKMSSVVGMNDYIVGAKSKDYDSIVALLDPYNIVYIKCFLEKDLINYFVYNCISYKEYCDDNFNCIPINIDNKNMIVDKNNITYLYEENTVDGKKYALGEFHYDGNLQFFEYKKIKELK